MIIQISRHVLWCVFQSRICLVLGFQCPMCQFWVFSVPCVSSGFSVSHVSVLGFQCPMCQFWVFSVPCVSSGFSVSHVSVLGFQCPMCQFWVFTVPCVSAPCVSFVTSCCRSVSFCIELCVVLALNSWGWYFCCKIWAFTFSFFWWKLRWNYFQNYFHLEQNKMEKKWKNTKTLKHCLKCTLICLLVLTDLHISGPQQHSNLKSCVSVYVLLQSSVAFSC